MSRRFPHNDEARSGAGAARRRERRVPPPLDAGALQDMALRYVSRYATSRHKLIGYLNRKLRERGWSEERPADPDALAARFDELGYLNDSDYARMKGGSLLRRGYGKRRVDQALSLAGIAAADRREADAMVEDGAYEAALVMARKRRIGPFAAAPADRDQRQKQLQAMLRAGHDFGIARALVFADEMEDIDLEQARRQSGATDVEDFGHDG